MFYTNQCLEKNVAQWIQKMIGRYRENLLLLNRFYKACSETWAALEPPEDEWQVIRDMAVFAALSAVARCLCWGYWQFGIALFRAVIWYILLTVLMIGIGRLISLLAVVFDTEIDASRSMQLSFYGFLPMLVSGILYVNPLLGVLVPFISLFGLYILYHGLNAQFPSMNNRQWMLIIIGIGMVAGVWIIGALTGGLFLPKMGS